MPIFNRTKSCSVCIEGENLVARAVFLDTVHEMTLEITVNPRDMIVHKIKADILRAPYSPCLEVKEKIKVLEGIKIGRGMTKIISERFGGPLGCVHLDDLFLDATKALITARYSWLRLTTDDLVRDTKKAMEELKGTCYAYTQDVVLSGKEQPNQNIGY